jgi:hypothetical protein
MKGKVITVNLKMLIFFFCSLILPGLAFADGYVTGEECEPAMDAAIYFMTLGPESDVALRVSLYEYWGESYIFIDEIWYDDIEGVAHYGDSFELSAVDIAEAIESDWLWRLEFLQWLDSDTFELKANDGEVLFTIEHMEEGSFHICRTDQ